MGKVKRTLLYTLSLALSLILAAPCGAQEPGSQREKKITAAVLNFVNADGRISALGHALSQASIRHLVKNNPQLQVVERTELRRLEQELDFSESGYIQDESAAHYGEMLGADFVIFGTLTKRRLRVEVEIKVVNTRTAAILSAVKTELYSIEYRRMYDDIIFDPVKAVNSTELTGRNAEEILNKIKIILDECVEDWDV
jgi:TolB-like protein